MRIPTTNEVLQTLSRQTLGSRRVMAGASPTARDRVNFGDTLVTAIEEAGAAERAAGAQVDRFIRGEAGIHETVIAQERAGLMLRYAVTMKNRAVEAYRELMNTQI